MTIRPGQDALLLFAKGLAMGAADVVPGVSGGTVAFITGVYQRLLTSLTSFNPQLLRLLRDRNLAGALRHVDAAFLLPLGAGILSAFAGLAKLVSWLLAEHPAPTWALFFGLIAASVVRVSGRVDRWTPAAMAALAAGAAGAYLLVGLVPATTPETLWFVALSGALAICAMILPGVSGSFILLLLGKYRFMVAALLKPDVLVAGTFIAGCAVGLLSFSRLLRWLLERHPGPTIALLTGFMAGSLRKIWPWKETVLAVPDRHGELVPVVQANILPAIGGPFWLAVLAAVSGAAMVLILDRPGRRRLQ